MGTLQGTPTQLCKVVDAEVIVMFPLGKFYVCRITIQAEAPTDSPFPSSCGVCCGFHGASRLGLCSTCQREFDASGRRS